MRYSYLLFHECADPKLHKYYINRAIASTLDATLRSLNIRWLASIFKGRETVRGWGFTARLEYSLYLLISTFTELNSH